MSHRAIQRLRQLEKTNGLNRTNDDEFLKMETDDDDEDTSRPRIKASVFVASAWSSSDDEEDEEEGCVNKCVDDEDIAETQPNETLQRVAVTSKSSTHLLTQPSSSSTADKSNKDDWEDLFLVSTVQQPVSLLLVGDNKSDDPLSCKQTHHHVLLEGIRLSDFNVQKTLSEFLLVQSDDDAPNRRKKKNSTTHRPLKGYIAFKTFLFGEPQYDWLTPSSSSLSHRSKRYTGPPTFMVGGLGFRKVEEIYPWPYDHYLATARISTQNHHASTTPTCTWYSFVHSNEYQSDVSEFITHIQSSGNIQALALFIADCPYCIQALYPLALFCLQTRQQEQGLNILLRILYILECAIGPSFSFLPTATSLDPSLGIQGEQEEEEKDKNTWKLMHFQAEENTTFFWTLFRLIQVSSRMGCMKTALAVSRLVLSLDPLRDPLGVLLVMDTYALSIGQDQHLEWIVDMVESNTIVLYHAFENDPAGNLSNQPGSLIDLPNWSFSYALALFRLEQQQGISNHRKMTSIQALTRAIIRFPGIPLLLLEKNHADVHGRSCRRDWSSVLPQLQQRKQSSSRYVSKVHQQSTKYLSMYDTILDRISTIYTSQCYKCWATDDIMPWLYDACIQAVQTTEELDEEEWKENLSNPLVLIRYLSCDQQDFQDTFPLLPAEEANILDPATLSMALRVDPNFRRGRYLQTRRAGREQERMGREGGDGPLVDGMGIPITRIDPDLPLVEVFLRSLMPWARVDGVRR